MERAVLFFDIDGTLLSEVTRTIPESAVHALEEARRKGHLVFINTGRTACSVPPEIRRLPVDGILCGCGIYAEYRGQVIFEEHLDAKAAASIVEMAEKCRVEALYEGMEDVYFSSRISRFDSLENTRRYMKNRGLGVERYIEQGGCPYDKIFAYTDRESKKEEFFDFLTDYMEILDRGDNTYECIVKGYSKGTIIDYILHYFNLGRERSYVFGDSSNDLAMFQYAAHGIAMGKHDKVLDPYTEYVAPKVEEEGIWQAMKHLGLID